MLTDKEKEQLKTQHKQERDGRMRDRIKAVLLTDKGWSSEAIAEALLISDQAVRNHVRDYDVSRKLMPESGGSDEKMFEEQSKKLLSHLENHVYLFVKDIIAYVVSTFGLVYTVSGMRNWLHRHGFSYKKPAIVPGKANKKRQAQ